MENVKERVSVESGSRFVGVVFLYMFCALLLTAGIAAGLGLLFTKVLPIDNSISPSANTNFPIYIGILIGASVVLLIDMIWFMFAGFRQKSILVPFIIYAVAMGVLGSSLAIFVNPMIMGAAFGVTSLLFGGMGLIGYFSKKDLSILALIAFGLLMGAGLMSLFNLLWIFVLAPMGLLGVLQPMYWAIEGIVLVAVLLITAFDIHNVKTIAQRGEGNNNVALYCAFNLYVDFINIFLRVLRFILIATSKN